MAPQLLSIPLQGSYLRTLEGVRFRCLSSSLGRILDRTSSNTSSPFHCIELETPGPVPVTTGEDTGDTTLPPNLQLFPVPFLLYRPGRSRRLFQVEFLKRPLLVFDPRSRLFVFPKGSFLLVSLPTPFLGPTLSPTGNPSPTHTMDPGPSPSTGPFLPTRSLSGRRIPSSTPYALKRTRVLPWRRRWDPNLLSLCDTTTGRPPGRRRTSSSWNLGGEKDRLWKGWREVTHGSMVSVLWLIRTKRETKTTQNRTNYGAGDVRDTKGTGRQGTRQPPHGRNGV